MKTERRPQVNWSEDEDLLLAETVLRYMRNNKRMGDAYKEFADGTNGLRSEATANWRWHAELKKNYKTAIELAKKQAKGNKNIPSIENVVEKVAEIGDVMKTTVQNAIGNPLQSAEDFVANVIGHIKNINFETPQPEVKKLEFADVIAALWGMEAEHKTMKELIENQHNTIVSQNEELIAARALIDELSIRQQPLIAQDDYVALMKILERARSLSQ